MKRSEFRIALELGGSHGACQLDMKQSDNYRRIHIDLLDGGKPYPVSENCFAVFLAKRSTGDVFFNECTIRDGAVEYDITPKTTEKAGILQCEIRLYDGQVTLTPDDMGSLYLPNEDVHLLSTCTFTIFVHDAVYDDQRLMVGGGEVSKLNALVTEAAAAIAEARSVREAKDAGELDGVSATHQWVGTRLVVSSASGTSSADLVGPAGPKGETGEKGEKGDRGEPGFLVDDETVGEDPWSSRKILETLCPRFVLQGNLVCCHPAPGFPMNVDADYYEGVIELTGCGKNLYDAGTYPLDTEGYIYENSGGTSNSNTYRRTDYIPVSHLRGQTICLNHAPVGTNFPGMAFYDRDKVYISGGKGDGILVPENAVYMRFSVSADKTAGVQLELGSVATAYESYRGQSWQMQTNGDLFTFVPGSGQNWFYACQNGEPWPICLIGRSDPLPLLEKLAKEVGYV